MTFLLESTVPLLALIGTGLVSAGLVMLLMTLGMPDEKWLSYVRTTIQQHSKLFGENYG